jgi:hypothetical protein
LDTLQTIIERSSHARRKPRASVVLGKYSWNVAILSFLRSEATKNPLLVAKMRTPHEVRYNILTIRDLSTRFGVFEAKWY